MKKLSDGHLLEFRGVAVIITDSPYALRFLRRVDQLEAARKRICDLERLVKPEALNDSLEAGNGAGFGISL